MEQSNKTSQMWKDATMVAKAKPSPLNGFDLFNYMAAIVTNRGTQAGYEVFKRWKEELEEKAANGLGPWKPGEEEKFRVMCVRWTTAKWRRQWIRLLPLWKKRTRFVW